MEVEVLFPGHIGRSGGCRVYSAGLMVSRSTHLLKRSITGTFAAVLHREEDMYVAECPGVGTAR